MEGADPVSTVRCGFGASVKGVGYFMIVNHSNTNRGKAGAKTLEKSHVASQLTSVLVPPASPPSSGQKLVQGTAHSQWM